MYTGFLHTHNMLRWVILVLFLIVIVKSFIGWVGNKKWNKSEQVESLLTAILNNYTSQKVDSFLWTISEIRVGVKICSDLLKKNTIKENICFQANSVTDLGMEALAELLCCNDTITSINLFGNPITAKG